MHTSCKDYKMQQGNKEKCKSNRDKADVGLMESSNSVEPEHIGSVLDDLFVLIKCMSAVFDV